MSHDTFGAQTISTASTLRLAQTGNALSALDSLSTGARDLTQLVGELERDVERLRQRRKPSAASGSVGDRLRRERLDEETQLTVRQASAVRDALRSLRSEAAELSESTLPAAQRAALDEELRRDEAACEAALEDALTMAEQHVATQRVPSYHEAVGKDQWVSAGVQIAGTPDPIDTLPAQNAPSREPPAELRAGLDETARSMRALVYGARPPKPEAMQGQEPSDSRVSALQSRWASWSERTQAPTIMDPNEMTQWIMRQAYIDNSADMRSYAIKIQFQTTLKGLLRDELNRAREARSTLSKGSGSKDKALSAPFLRKKIRQDPLVDADGNHSVRRPEDDGEIVDVDALNDYIRDMETALSTSSDDMQLAQLELQGMTQRQQQVLNALSNLSKTLHETSMAILRKIGN